MRKLDLPAVLVVTALTGAGTAALVANPGCGGDDAPTCEVYCVPDGGPNSGCMGPDPVCATGPNLDQCPTGCIPEPVA